MYHDDDEDDDDASHVGWGIKKETKKVKSEESSK